MFLTHDTAPFSTFLRSPVRIKQQGKRRFCDPSIAAALLGATPALLMRDLRTFGFLFESLAVRDLEIYAEALGGRLFHYQDYNNGSSDADVDHVNIVCNSALDSIGVLVEGCDNTLTKLRIYGAHTGVRLVSQGNVLRDTGSGFWKPLLAERMSVCVGVRF